MSLTGFSGLNAIISNLAAYGSGTAYTLTNAAAAVVFGTTSPTITISTAGIWLISGGATIDYVGATFAANQTIPVKLRRTNNTATDLASGSVTATAQIITALTFTGPSVNVPPVVYTTALATDIITLFANVSTLPGAGSITISNAWITALKVG